MRISSYIENKGYKIEKVNWNNYYVIVIWS